MGAMVEEDRKFLARWSRRKEEAREGGEAPADDPTAEDDSGAAKGESPDLPEASPDEAEILARLPDIDSLDEDSDFTVFLSEGVPAAIRRRALRKLWRLNPIFANLDGLNDYDEDFTDAANLVEGVKTIYKVGKGMFNKDEPPKTPQEVAAESSTEPDADEDEQETPEAAKAGSPDPADLPSPPDPAEMSSAEVATGAGPAPVSVTQHDGEAPTQKSGRPRGSAARRRWGDSAG
jgi:hypothetical protein